MKMRTNNTRRIHTPSQTIFNKKKVTIRSSNKIEIQYKIADPLYINDNKNINESKNQ
jgi:hypothetical protein